jgi:hypothetical protein
MMQPITHLLVRVRVLEDVQQRGEAQPEHYGHVPEFIGPNVNSKKLQANSSKFKQIQT